MCFAVFIVDRRCTCMCRVRRNLFGAICVEHARRMLGNRDAFSRLSSICNFPYAGVVVQSPAISFTKARNPFWACTWMQHAHAFSAHRIWEEQILRRLLTPYAKRTPILTRVLFCFIFKLIILKNSISQWHHRQQMEWTETAFRSYLEIAAGGRIKSSRNHRRLNTIGRTALSKPIGNVAIAHTHTRAPRGTRVISTLYEKPCFVSIRCGTWSGWRK